MLRIFQSPSIDRYHVTLIARPETWSELDELIKSHGSRLALVVKGRTGDDRVERVTCTPVDAKLIMEVARGH